MEISRTPEYGTERTIRKFLWLPKTFFKEAGVSQTLWLETVELTQKFKRTYDFFGVISDLWVTIDYKRLNNK